MEQILENILQEINRASRRMCTNEVPAKYYRAIGTRKAEEIIRKHLSGKETDVFPNAGWIPVEERLPERRGNYLVTVESAWARFILISHYNAPGWTEEYGGQKIIAWQSLTEPYREGKEDAKCIKKQKN